MSATTPKLRSWWRYIGGLLILGLAGNAAWYAARLLGACLGWGVMPDTRDLAWLALVTLILAARVFVSSIARDRANARERRAPRDEIPGFGRPS